MHRVKADLCSTQLNSFLVEGDDFLILVHVSIEFRLTASKPYAIINGRISVTASRGVSGNVNGGWEEFGDAVV